MKFIVIILLIAILATLGSGLFRMTARNHDSEKLQKALRIRVTLSIVLLVFLVVSYFMGWLQT